MIDSDRIYGVREPDGFTRDSISCPDDLSIFISSVSFGYKVCCEFVSIREICENKDILYKISTYP